MKYTLVLLLLCGCAWNRQSAETTTITNNTNGVPTTVKTHATSTTLAWGDARAIVDKTRASAGKTSSVGASGIDENTTSTNAITALSEMRKLVEALPK